MYVQFFFICFLNFLFPFCYWWPYFILCGMFDKISAVSYSCSLRQAYFQYNRWFYHMLIWIFFPWQLQPKLVAISNFISFVNPKAPLYPRLAQGKSWDEVNISSYFKALSIWRHCKVAKGCNKSSYIICILFYQVMTVPSVWLPPALSKKTWRCSCKAGKFARASSTSKLSMTTESKRSLQRDWTDVVAEDLEFQMCTTCRLDLHKAVGVLRSLAVTSSPVKYVPSWCRREDALMNRAWLQAGCLQRAWVHLCSGDEWCYVWVKRQLSCGSRFHHSCMDIAHCKMRCEEDAGDLACLIHASARASEGGRCIEGFRLGQILARW